MTDIFQFDYFGLYDIPTFYLSSPTFSFVYPLGQISDRAYSAKFTSMSELSFRADEYVNGERVPYYDYLTYRMLVYTSASSMGRFMISEVTEEGNGVEKYKEVKCKSLESQMLTKKVNLFEGTHQFYNSTGNSLLDIIINDYLPNWSFAIHDTPSGSLVSRYRTFDVSDTTVYNFLTVEVSQAYKCIFTFDTMNRIIHAYEETVATIPTDIYISYDNAIQKMSKEESVDNLATSMNVLGGNGLDISYVNPLGTNKIYNFDYFTTGSWMDSSLSTAIQNWSALVSGSQAGYRTLVEELSVLEDEAATLETDLSSVEAELSALTTELNAAIAGGYPTTEISGSISAKDSERIQLEEDISVNSANLTAKLDEMYLVNTALSLKNTNNFTESQYSQLQSFIIETSYINDNFLKTDTMSGSAITAESQLLYEDALNTLSKVSSPRYRFSIDAVNILLIKEFETFKNQLDLGKNITIEISEGTTVEATLLGYDINFDDPSSFKMTFGNRLHLDDDYFQYGDFMSQIVSASRQNQLKSYGWNQSSGNLSEINAFISSPINSEHNNIIAGESRQLILDGTGLKARTLSGSAYMPEQILLNNNFVFTDDNWQSSKPALGKVVFTDFYETTPQQLDIITGSGFGLIADSLKGHIVANEKLVIGNSSGSLVITGSTVNLTIKADNGHNMIYFNSASGIYITKDGVPIFYLDSSGSLHITHS